jgi:DNA-binding MarR family transcriptional regulator
MRLREGGYSPDSENLAEMTKRTPKTKAHRLDESPADDAVSLDLYNQPGHLIRRANQIAVGMFNDVLGSDVTPAQYAILRMVQERPGIHQVGLSKLVALDTSTTALTAARLEGKGLLVRSPSAADSRQLELHLTQSGVALLESLISGVHRLRAQLLDGLDPSERALFVQLLRKFVHLNNEQSRAPLRT